MKIQLSDHFTYKKLLRYSLPSILMMVFTSIYGVVDGFFVSNYAGKTEFAAVNFVYPFLMILGTLGFMVGSGGSALIGKTLGQGENEKANGIFSMLTLFTAISGIVICVVSLLIIEPVLKLVGCTEAMLPLCVTYGKIFSLGLPFLMIQFEFQSIFVVAEKPKLGFVATLSAGVMNMALDLILVGVLKQGIVGAAVATVISQVVYAIFPFVYFSIKNNSLLRFTKPLFSIKALLVTLGNGSSEFVSTVSMSLVSMIYNYQLLRYLGEDGIDAYGVLMYVNLVFLSIFIGFTVGTSPIISYHFGAMNFAELKNLFKKGLTVVLTSAFAMLLLGELLARPIAVLFVGYDDNLVKITVEAFRYFSFSFFFASIPIYGSSFFTALNDGLISAIISFLRTVVFQIAAIIFLPMIFGVSGIWSSLVFAEVIATIVTCYFIVSKRKKYHYL